MKRVFIVLVSVFLLSFTVATTNWEFRREENGIKVYATKVEGYKYEKCKAVSDVNADLSALYKYIKDPMNYKNFSDRIMKLETIKKFDNKVLYYMQVDLPWPIYNRDGVYELEVKSKTDAEAIITIRARPDLLPEQDGFIRIHMADSYYKLTSKGAGKSHLHFEQHTDPNGSVPAWLINHYLEDGPIGNITVIKNSVENK